MHGIFHVFEYHFLTLRPAAGGRPGELKQAKGKEGSSIRRPAGTTVSFFFFPPSEARRKSHREPDRLKQDRRAIYLFTISEDSLSLEEEVDACAGPADDAVPVSGGGEKKK